jgi:hypothetical protein
MKKLIIFTILLLASCSGTYNPNKASYQRNGILFTKVNPPKRHINPIDLSKEKLVMAGYDRLNAGIGFVCASFFAALLFSNPLTNRLMNVGLGVGGYLCISGLIKIFIAQYLIYFVFGAGLLLLFAIVFKFRRSSIVKSKEWIKEQICGLNSSKVRTI